MRESVTHDRLVAFMQGISETALRGRHFRVFLVGGATAVAFGWRESTIDVDVHAEDEAVLRDVQRIKERQRINVELAQPEHFVPPLAEADERHLFIATYGAPSPLPRNGGVPKSAR